MRPEMHPQVDARYDRTIEGTYQHMLAKNNLAVAVAPHFEALSSKACFVPIDI